MRRQGGGLDLPIDQYKNMDKKQVEAKLLLRASMVYMLPIHQHNFKVETNLTP